MWDLSSLARFASIPLPLSAFISISLSLSLCLCVSLFHLPAFALSLAPAVPLSPALQFLPNHTMSLKSKYGRYLCALRSPFGSHAVTADRSALSPPFIHVCSSLMLVIPRLFSAAKHWR